MRSKLSLLALASVSYSLPDGDMYDLSIRRRLELVFEHDLDVSDDLLKACRETTHFLEDI